MNSKGGDMFLTRTLLALVVSLSAAIPAFGAEYIVKTKDSGPQAMNFQAFAGIQIMDQHQVGNLVKIDLSEEQIEKVLPELMKHPQVEYIVKDFKLKAFRTPPSSQELREQWAIAKVNADKAWKLAGNKGTRNVTVAVIDTGVDYNHESLKPNSVPGYDFRHNDNDPMDETSAANPGHGTHCAGIIGATGLIDGGIIGISPEVSLMPIRFLGKDGSGDLMGGIKSIDYAIEKGVKIISASWGATVPRAQAAPLIEAVKRASDAGVIFVAAAANDGRSNDRTDVFPANARFENTISVAASDSRDGKPNWSNYGKMTVDLAAPGHQIMSTLPSDKYGNLSGTSMATPLVSGLVALLASQRPNITGAEVRSLMQVTGAKVQIETACDCRVDAGAAMESLLSNQMIVVPAAMTVDPNGGTQQFTAMHGAGQLTYSLSNADVAEIDSNGLLTAKAEGETTVTVTDAEGNTATSLRILLAKSGGSPGGPGNPGNPGDCPVGDQALCDIICEIMPDMPFCSK